MSIRIKGFLILLFFGLTPLLVITVNSRQSIIRLGEELSHEAQVHREATISRDLTQAARVSADAISQDIAGLRLSLSYLADSTTQVLSAADIRPPGKAYRPEDFKDSATAPPDLQMSWRYARTTAGGVVMPSAVSTLFPVVVTPPGEGENLESRIARLQGLTAAFREIYRLNKTVHRIYVGFDNGLHISFPGHGHYAAGFDPRKRPWFVDTRAGGEVTWLTHTDSSTAQVVFTVAVPIRDRDDRFIGVGAIDMLPTEFLKTDQLRARWSPDTVAYLVAPEKGPTDTPARLRIIAGAQNEAPAAQNPYLEIDSPAERGAFIEAMEAAESGYATLPHADTPSIWAFARFKPPMDDALRIVLIVPRRLVSSLSEQVSRIVLNQTYLIYRVTGITAALLLIIVVLVGWIGTRTILRPLYAMVDAWEKLSTGDFSVRLKERTGDERDTLIDAFNEVVPRLEAHWDLSRSLDLARQIQRNLLPEQMPAVAGLDITGDSRSCDQTGGDYYDVFKTGMAGEECYAVVVGDVSGHGVASALLMTTARAMIRSVSVLEEDPARRITLVNRLLFPDTSDTSDFITLFYLECDVARRRLRWVRAGHDPAILYDPSSDDFSELAGEGMALGIEAQFEFSASARPMGDPGQIIVIGTDGIWEAHNTRGEMFGKQRFRHVIREHHRSSARTIRDAVFSAVTEFAGPHQDDDITLAVIKLL